MKAPKEYGLWDGEIVVQVVRDLPQRHRNGMPKIEIIDTGNRVYFVERSRLAPVDLATLAPGDRLRMTSGGRITRLPPYQLPLFVPTEP